MKTLIAGLMLAMAGPCVAPTPPPQSSPETARSAVAAWSDAFNRDDAAELRWLVHPDARGAFDGDPALPAELAAWQVVRYRLGGPVKVDGRFEGRSGTLELGDGRRTEDRAIIVVQSEGRWWIWRR